MRWVVKIRTPGWASMDGTMDGMVWYFVRRWKVVGKAKEAVRVHVVGHGLPFNIYSCESAGRLGGVSYDILNAGPPAH